MKENDEQPIRFAIYLKSFGEIEDVMPIEEQVNSCREQVAKLGGIVVEEFTTDVDTEHLRDVRSLNKLIIMASRREIDAVMCWRYDQVARDYHEEFKLKSLFRDELRLGYYCVDGESYDGSLTQYPLEMRQFYQVFLDLLEEQLHSPHDEHAQETSEKRFAVYARTGVYPTSEPSLGAQTKLCKQVVKDKGGIVVGVYRDGKASGWEDLSNKGFQNLLSGATRKKFDAVIMWRFECLSDNHFNLVHLKSFLRNHYGLELYCVSGFSADDEDTKPLMIVEQLFDALSYSINFQPVQPKF